MSQALRKLVLAIGRDQEGVAEFQTGWKIYSHKRLQ